MKQRSRHPVNLVAGLKRVAAQGCVTHRTNRLLSRNLSPCLLAENRRHIVDKERGSKTNTDARSRNSANVLRGKGGIMQHEEDKLKITS